ncbi:MAG: MFS transporter [Victivallaceae bacterium]
MEDSTTKAAAPKVWHAGTLTYTTAGIVMLFVWLLWGDFTWSMKERAVGYVAALMVKSFGVSDLVYSLLIVSFPNFTNIFLGPIVSYMSDRHRGRFGRRIPFLFFTTPFVVIGLIGLGFSAPLGEWLQRLIGEDVISLNMAKLIAFSFFWIILDFGTTLANSIFVALANDVVPAGLIGRFLALFRAVSLICAVLFNYYLFGYAESHALYIFGGLGILYGIGLFSMCLKVKEGEYPPIPREETGSAGRNALRSTVDYFKQCFSLPYYRWVIAAFVICAVSVLPINVYVIFFVKKLNMSFADFGKLTALIFMVAFVMSFFLGMLADKYHPLRMGIVSMAILSVILLVGGFLIKDIRSFSIVFFVQQIAIMSFNTLTASYGQRLFPKVIFAQFNSAMMLINAIVTMSLAPAVGYFLDVIGNDYRYIYLIGGIIGLAGLASLLVVYRYFLKFGGDKGYHAPLPPGITVEMQ